MRWSGLGNSSVAEKQTRITDSDASGRAWDHVLFVAIFLLGAAITVALRLGTSMDILWVLLFPLSFMGIYMYLVKTNRHRLRKDHAADNVYYLGFLFTIITLGTALIRYQTSDNPDVTQIIGDLGIGLSTTVVGLLGRIVLGQYGQQPADIDEGVRTSLVRAAENLRKNFLIVGEEISRIQTATKQMVEETNTNLQTTSKGIAAASQRIESNLAAVSIPEDILAAKFSPAFDRLAEAVDAVIKRLDKVEVKPRILDEKLDKTLKPLMESISTLNKAIKGVDSSVTSLVRRSMDMAEIARTSSKIAENRERMIRWFDEITANQERLAGINKSLKDSAAAIDLLHPSMDRLKRDFGDAHGQYRQSIDAMIGTMSEANKRAGEMSQQIQRLGDEFAAAMEKLITSANKSTRK